MSIVTRFSLLSLLRGLGDVLVLAFSTASSSAALPAALARMEDWGASPRTTSFVLPLGYSFNLTGTAVYLPLVTLFWAQLNGVALSYRNQFLMLAFILIVIRGIPTIPRALFLVWGSVLARFDLPPEGVVVLLGIDPFDRHGAHDGERRGQLPGGGSGPSMGSFAKPKRARQGGSVSRGRFRLARRFWENRRCAFRPR